jgi:branched-chain amino acid transport system substrate-binding protein
VIVCSGGGADFLVTENDNIYIGQASGETFGWCAADYIAEDLGLTKIAAINSDFDFISSFSSGLEDHGGELGLENVSTQVVQYGEPDYRVVLTNVAGAEPEIILLGNFDADNGRIVNQARELGIEVPLMEYIGVGYSQTFVDLAGANAEGFYLTVGADVAPEEGSFAADVAAEYKERYGKEFGSVQQAFQSVHSIVLAIEAGAETREQLGEYLERDFEVDGVMGAVGFGANRKLLEARITIAQLNGQTAEDQEAVAVCQQNNDGTVERASLDSGG